jgi:nicotinamidase-related amidase
MAAEAGTRVWDRFLSDQDKAHVEMVGEKRRRAFGNKPALLLIDLYRWVFGDEPEPLLESVKKWPGTCGMAGWEAMPHIQKLLAAARSAGIPVIHTTGAELEMVHWANREAREVDPVMADRMRRKNEIMPEVSPINGELVIRKSSPSAFWGTPLIGHLVSNNIDTIIVGGESTSGCVRSSVVDGATSRFKMFVVEECCFDRHEACHAIDLFTMHQKYATVLPLQETLSYLSRFEDGKDTGVTLTS